VAQENVLLTLTTGFEVQFSLLCHSC
jgi:hypothetical protein